MDLLKNNNKYLLSLLLWIFIYNFESKAQTYQWGKDVGGTGMDVAWGTTSDKFGNVFICGTFTGTMDFDPGIGTDIHTSNGAQDGFVEKFDASGNFIWARTWGSSTVWGDMAQSVAADSLGNVYVTGEFYYTVDFDPGSGVDNHTAAGNDDIYVLKLGPTGNFKWARTFGGVNYDFGYFIIVAPNGNVYSTGGFQGTVDFDPGTGTDNHTTANNYYDVYIENLDTAGNFVWAKNFGTGSDDFSECIVTDSLSNVYTTGYFLGNSIDLDPSTSSDVHSGHGAYADVFIQKLGPAGNYIWGKTFGGSGDDSGKSVAIGPGGKVYIAGQYNLTVDFDPGTGFNNHTSVHDQDIFVDKLDALGNFVWARTFGGLFTDFSQSIITNSIGDVFVTGLFAHTTDFDPGTGIDSIHPLNNTPDIYIEKLDKSGNYHWARNLGGFGGYAYSLAVSGRDLYLAGHFQSTMDFDPNLPSDNHTAAGNNDAFLIKFSTCDPPVYVEVDTIMCVNHAPITLSAATPPGGTYSGTGVSGNVFDPSVAGAGNWIIQYSFTDMAGCTSSAYQMISVQACTGISENLDEDQINLFPIPCNDKLYMDMNLEVSAQVEILNMMGELVGTFEWTKEKNVLDVHMLRSGLYFIRINTGKNAYVKKIVKN